MNYKKATYIANAVFILVAASCLFMISKFSPSVIKLVIGPGYYPALLCAALILTSVISLIKTYKSAENQVIKIPKIKNVLMVVAVFVAFLVLWKITQQFYIVSFILMGILLYFLNPQPTSAKKAVKTFLISLSMQLIVYVIFQKFMYFRF